MTGQFGGPGESAGPNDGSDESGGDDDQASRIDTNRTVLDYGRRP